MSRKLTLYRRGAFALMLLFTRFSVRADDSWTEVRSPHFVVNSNAGDKEARRVADQFEQIRQMFHSAFPTLRIDPPQPIVVVAAKNENTIKLFLPEEWEVKGHIHHTGFYQPAQDKDYVILRLDTQGSNPFHTLYHEYTHALLRINFSRLPLWLDEGLAEFFGNSTIGEKEIKTGTIDPGHLYLLNQSRLIPIETLLDVDRNSLYYNEENRASVFYAESWVLVHFLMMDEEARQKQLMKSFLTAWQNSGNQIEAARETFGDLKQFGKKIESYASRGSFRIGLIKVRQEAAGKNDIVRRLSPGEVMALRGDFLSHHHRLEQALPVLEQAVQTEPNLPFAHEALAYYHYRRQEIEQADKEITVAIRLGATGFGPHYFHGLFLMQRGDANGKSIEQARNSLERAIQLNPQFAPAYESLAMDYARSPETQKQALSAALKAVELDSGQLSYAINLAYLLLNNRRFEEARTVAQRILTAAGSPAEKEIANNLLSHVHQGEEWSAKGASRAAPAPRISVSTDSSVSSGPSSPVTPRPPSEMHLLGVDGEISSVECSNKPEIVINVGLASGPVSFHAADFSKVSLSWADGQPKPTLEMCGQWKGRRVKVWILATPGKNYVGEISKLHFF